MSLSSGGNPPGPDHVRGLLGRCRQTVDPGSATGRDSGPFFVTRLCVQSDESPLTYGGRATSLARPREVSQEKGGRDSRPVGAFGVAGVRCPLMNERATNRPVSIPVALRDSLWPALRTTAVDKHVVAYLAMPVPAGIQ